jgi:hypothetical protein
MSKTTKQVSAFRHISAAIDHFEKQNYECAITLAAAGEGQIVERSTGHFFRVIRAKFSGQALKHSSGPDEKEITEQEVVVTIIRGIQKYVGTYEVSHSKFETFSKWCIANGFPYDNRTRSTSLGSPSSSGWVLYATHIPL